MGSQSTGVAAPALGTRQLSSWRVRMSRTDRYVLAKDVESAAWLALELAKELDDTLLDVVINE